MKKMPSKFLSVSFLILLSWAQVIGQNPEPFGFLSHPVLQSIEQDRVSIYWVTNRSSTSWVEYGQTEEIQMKARHSQHGLFDANLPVQKALLSRLTPGTTYFYRTVSVEIARYEAYNIVYGDTLYSEVHSFTTPSSGLTSFSFLAFNDVHNRPGFIKETVARERDFEFVAYLGDIMGHIDEEDHIVENILSPASDYFATQKPLFFVRGNHEARGPRARKLIDYIDTPEGNFYYSFKFGPVFFIVLDSGEDKPDTNQYYYGLADFDAYRAQQSKWLEGVVGSREFEESHFRIVLVHWPVLLDEVVADDDIHKHGMLNAQQNFAQQLNDAGVDLMLCGHTHRYQVIHPEAQVTTFPVIVGGGHIQAPGSTYTRVDYSQDRLTVFLKSTQGELIEQVVIMQKD